MKKSIPFLIFGLLFTTTPTFLKAESITAQDTIKANVTWSADTVKVMASMLIWDDVTLTIEPGTRVEFHGPYHMHVHGTIIADGTEQDTIVFTSADTSGFWDESVLDGAWDGITFNNATGYGGADGSMSDNDTSVFDHCRIEFVKSHPTESLVWSALEVVVFSNLVISNSEIHHNYSHYMGGAITAGSESDIKILGNHIHHNRAYKRGGGIFLKNNATIIKGNIIEDNSTTGIDNNGNGGAIGIIGGSPAVMNNIIRYNSAMNGAGIDLYNCFGRIEENTISYNECYNNLPQEASTGGGISANWGSTAKIINNKLANNKADEGGAINIYNSDVSVIGNLMVNDSAGAGGALRAVSFSGVIINNTIANNYAGYAGGIELIDSEPLFLNNIVWNNPDPSGNQISLSGYFANLHIQNSVIQKGLLSIVGESTATTSKLITANPAFEQPTGDVGAGVPGLTGKWWVRDTSVCVNAGNENYTGKMPPKDIGGKDRVLHSIIDIGAYEVYVSSITVKDTIKTNTTWIADTVKIDSSIVIMDDVTLTILPGTRVEFLDTHRIQVIGTLIAAGGPDNRIHFTVDDTTGNYDKYSPDGSWQGIHFKNDLENLNAVMDDNDTSVLRYCDFSYIKGLGEYNTHIVSAVSVRYFDKLTISNCRFYENHSYYSSVSIDLFKADLTIKGCEFFNNSATQGPAVWAESSNLTIEDCNFHDNYSDHWGGAVCTAGGELTIKNSEFRYNQSGDRGGAVYSERTKALITHSWFENNSANGRGGAICVNYENFQVVNNILVNNTGGAGGALYCLYVDEALTINNTICNNWARNGGGMYTAFSDHTSVNDILYGNDVEYDGKQYGMYSVSATIYFRNTNLEGGTGGIGFWIGQELTGTYTNIIDSLPQFIRPSEGPGNIYDVTNANWNLKSISPCINNGTLLGAALLEEEDIRGNPRVYDTLIDIGAYESQYGLPDIQSQPDNYIGCVGDTVIFRVRTRFKSFYQWQKYGNDITGATESTLKLDSITSANDGNYKCIVSNSFGSLETNSVYLLARSAPEIVRQPEDIWAIEGKKTTISSTGIGTQPLHIQWYKDGVMMPGKTWPDLWIYNTDSVDEGRYYCEVSNACRTIQSDTVQLYIAPQICMVTVDTSTGDNLVIWEKNTTAPIASYNVYRESIVAGEYDAIGNVTASSLSVYSDTGAIPAVQAYIYKITAVTADGIESDVDLCRPHKTIHLLTSLNTEYKTAQLDWDQYYGFDYGTYHIFRSGTLWGFSIIHAMASSTSTWLDVNATEDETYYYRVAVEKPESCYPTGNTKAGTGPYHHSLSNLDDNKLKTGLDDIASGSLKIYPNPFTERTTVEFPNLELSEYRVTIRDISGKVVMTDLVSADRLVIERGDLKAGLYSIELAGKRIYRDRFVVK